MKHAITIAILSLFGIVAGGPAQAETRRIAAEGDWFVTEVGASGCAWSVRTSGGGVAFVDHVSVNYIEILLVPRTDRFVPGKSHYVHLWVDGQPTFSTGDTGTSDGTLVVKIETERELQHLLGAVRAGSDLQVIRHKEGLPIWKASLSGSNSTFLAWADCRKRLPRAAR